MYHDTLLLPLDHAANLMRILYYVCAQEEKLCNAARDGNEVEVNRLLVEGANVHFRDNRWVR